MKRNNLFYSIIGSLIALFTFSACIEDGITKSPSSQPTFSVDTLYMGTVLTDEGTPTYSLKVYNRHSKILNISRIGFKNGGTGLFRLNVDGMSGDVFNNVEIRPNDSIFLFVAATLPQNGGPLPIEVLEKIEFETNGVTSEVVISAQGQDVERLKATVLENSVRWADGMPRQIIDSLVVAEGVTLTLGEGTNLLFHDGAELVVRGTLISEGTAEKPVVMTGDRFGLVATNIPYEIMSKQWGGVYFAPTSKANVLNFTTIKNSTWGVAVDSIASAETPALTMVNCRLRNAEGYVFQAHFADITAVGCEFAEAGAGTVFLRGGKHQFNHCTFSNNYLFSAIRGPLITFDHFNDDTALEGSPLPYMQAEITNSILYGIGVELSHGVLDDSEIYIRRCLFKSTGSDDDHFLNVIWGEDPLFYTDRSSYLFDYRLQENSPALGMADTELDSPLLPQVDINGTPRPVHPAIGAYEL